jgi:hypothetical protein
MSSPFFESYNEIKNYLKESGKFIYWYSVDGKLLVVDSSKKSSRKKLLKTKYEGDLFRLSMTFHTGKKFGQGGPIAINCRTFRLEDGKIIKVPGDKNGVFWFDKRWLEGQSRWNSFWIEDIIRKLRSKNFKFGIGIKLYL